MNLKSFNYQPGTITKIGIRNIFLYNSIRQFKISTTNKVKQINIIYYTTMNLMSWQRSAFEDKEIFGDQVPPQIREQMSGPDLHVFTLKFLALKKLVFPP